MTAAEWREAHAKSCPKQTPTGPLVEWEGAVFRWGVGFEEHIWDTIGGPGKPGRRRICVRCCGCGEEHRTEEIIDD